MGVRSLASLAAPFLIAIGTDDFIQTGDFNGLSVIVLLYIGTALLVWTGQYVQTLNLSYAGQSILLRMRIEMFDQLQRLSMSFFDRNQVGKLMSRVQSDVQQLQQKISERLNDIQAEPVPQMPTDDETADARQRRERFENLTPEQREEMRKRFEQMSPEEREKLRRQRRGPRRRRTESEDAAQQ